MVKRTVKSKVFRKISNDFSLHESLLINFIKSADPAGEIPLGAHYSGIWVWYFPPENPLYRIHFDYDLYRNRIRVLNIFRY